jgi:hypothetical protein
MPETVTSILAGYVLEQDFAKDAKISRRTAARYRNAPNGLPYLEFGGRIYIPIDAAGAWIKSRVQHPVDRAG